MGALSRDLRLALRGMRKHPGFSLAVVLSLGLGLGANTLVFTWMENLILDPYPAVAEAGRLVAINTSTPGAPESSISYPAYRDWRTAARSFEGMAVHATARLGMRLPGEEPAQTIWGQLVSGNYFDLLGVRPALGRTFLPEEEPAAVPVAVISDAFWRRRFGGDPAVIGRHLLLNGKDAVIIGVAAPGFGGTIVGLGFDLWVPVTLQPALGAGPGTLEDRQARWLLGFARLKDGVTLSQAREELDAVAREASRLHGEQPVTGAVVKLMREQLLGALLFPLFSSLMGVAALVLLIACANVANLLFARGASRQKEIGIRLALGAGPGRITRQLFAESALLAALGGAAGVLLAIWGKEMFRAFIPPAPFPVALAMQIDARVVLFAMLASLVTAGLFGLAPALRSSRSDLVTSLKDRVAGAASARWTLRDALVVSQVSLCVVSLVSAGLFFRSLQRAQQIDLGFSRPDRILLAATDLGLAGLDETAGLEAAGLLLERARALPGVDAASLSTMVPLGFGGHPVSPTRIEGYTPAPEESTSIERVIVGADYFETLGIPIVLGRGISPRDRRDTLRVAVVNEAFARRYWSGEDPIGKMIDQGAGWSTIVGVARDAKCRDLDETPYPVVYSAHQQWYRPAFTLHLLARTDPRGLIEPLRREFRSVNADLPFLDPRTLEEHMSAATFVQRIGVFTLGAFGALALLLSAIGVYGVMAYTVNLRRREIGVRLVLGATPRQVSGLVLAQALRLCSLGLLIGGAMAWGLGRLLAGQLLDVSPGDPPTFLLVSALLAAVIWIAAGLPARRASRLDPAEVLRVD